MANERKMAKNILCVSMKSILVRLYAVFSWMQAWSIRTTSPAVSIRFVHRIKSAGMKGMATKKATQGKIQATKGSVMGKSLYGIL